MPSRRWPHPPGRSALYAAITYILSMVALILPYPVLAHHLAALTVTLINTVLIILFFS